MHKQGQLIAQVTSTKPGPIAPYLDVQSVVEAAKFGILGV